MAVAAMAHAETPAPSEVELVRAVLGGTVMQAERHAAGERARALAVAPPWRLSPELQARREQANGPAGATTTALGAAVTVDLGLSGFPERRAARLRGEAGGLDRDVQLLQMVCTVRRHVIDLDAAARSLEAAEQAQVRLETTLSSVAALAEAGEVSRYERDRVSLAVTAHQGGLGDRHNDASLRRAELAPWLHGVAMDLTEAPRGPFRLAPPPPLPPLSEMLAWAEMHPELAALGRTAQAARVRLRAVRRDVVPDVTVYGAARWDMPPTGGVASEGYELGAALVVPGFDGSLAHVRQARAELAAADAALGRRHAEIVAEVRGAHERVLRLEQRDSSLDPGAVWTAATTRYGAGEATLDELLQTGASVEGASLSIIESERLRRRAWLDLACASGRFLVPEIQTVFEEARP